MVFHAKDRADFLKQFIVKFEEGYSNRESLIWELIDFLDWDKVYTYIIVTTFQGHTEYIEEDYDHECVTIHDLN
jgi:hypothetical protein